LISHLLKLVWNRKRATSLLIAEITCAFLVTFAVTALTVWIAGSYNEPLGFDYENVWNVSIDMRDISDDEWTAEQSQRVARILSEARGIDGVESAATILLPPFFFGTKEGVWRINGRDVFLEFDEVSDDFDKVMGIKVIRGRWFQKSDDALNWSPVVLDEDAARAVFGTEDPVGQLFDKESTPPTRVVGIVENFRKNGELSPDGNFVLERKRVGNPNDRPGRNILIKVREGASPELERHVKERLDAVAGDWTVSVEPLAESRKAIRKMQIGPIALLGTIAGFLLLMVAFGLSGVLWQSITVRRSELGLRRAIGASGGDIHRQILVELLLIATFGLVIGALLVLQIPILGLFTFFTTSNFVAAFLLSIAIMYLLTTICGLYPSWFATRIQPADALRAE
jgi:putative ABC transport system permease protein